MVGYGCPTSILGGSPWTSLVVLQAVDDIVVLLDVILLVLVGTVRRRAIVG